MGALTGGDVHLHLRVDASAFGATVTVLRRLYEVVNLGDLDRYARDLQRPGTGCRRRRDSNRIRAGSPIHRSLEGLATDRDLLEQYNAMR